MEQESVYAVADECSCIELVDVSQLYQCVQIKNILLALNKETPCLGIAALF